MRNRLLVLGLGLVAGAVLHGTAGAQVVRDTIPKKKDSTTLTVPLPARADSLLRDSLARKAARDSAKKLATLDSIERADSIKPPTAQSERPISIEINRRLHWTRDSLFATGAITVADLLERIPGYTGFHAGWVSTPAVPSYLGDTKRVRVFYDGLEHLTLDPRANGVLELGQINLWSAEDVTIEQGPEEIRVYIRSWRVTKTIPETRTDVSTGDQATNLYRGFFGRRWRNGLALQFAAQQFGTSPPLVLGGGSTQTGVVGRVGWSNPRWSVDGFITRISRDRDEIFADIQPGFLTPLDSIPQVSSTRRDMYARVAFADPDTSLFWGQVMAVSSKYEYTGLRTLPLRPFPQTAADTAFNNLPLDTSVVRSQYILSAGTARGPLHVSATERLIGGGGKTYSPLTLRATFNTLRLAASAFFETKSLDSVARSDVTLQLTPVSFVSVLGSVGRTNEPGFDIVRAAEKPLNSTLSTNYVRGEVGLRVKNLWLLGGVIRRDSIIAAPPAIFDTPFDSIGMFTTRGQSRATGGTIAVRGQLWRLLHADAWAVRWNDSSGFYRPRYQTRSELSIKTQLLDKFPSGNLGITGALVHEYRSGVNFPVGRNDDVTTVPGYRTISSLLEIRILQATISWQFRNFLGERYIQVPTYLMPRQTNFYGVRWSFFG